MSEQPSVGAGFSRGPGGKFVGMRYRGHEFTPRERWIAQHRAGVRLAYLLLLVVLVANAVAGLANGRAGAPEMLAIILTLACASGLVITSRVARAVDKRDRPGPYSARNDG